MRVNCQSILKIPSFSFSSPSNTLFLSCNHSLFILTYSLLVSEFHCLIHYFLSNGIQQKESGTSLRNHIFPTQFIGFIRPSFFFFFSYWVSDSATDFSSIFSKGRVWQRGLNKTPTNQNQIRARSPHSIHCFFHDKTDPNSIVAAQLKRSAIHSSALCVRNRREETPFPFFVAIRLFGFIFLLWNPIEFCVLSSFYLFIVHSNQCDGHSG